MGVVLSHSTSFQQKIPSNLNTNYLIRANKPKSISICSNKSSNLSLKLSRPSISSELTSNSTNSSMSPVNGADLNQNLTNENKSSSRMAEHDDQSKPKLKKKPSRLFTFRKSKHSNKKTGSPTLSKNSTFKNYGPNLPKSPSSNTGFKSGTSTSNQSTNKFTNYFTSNKSTEAQEKTTKAMNNDKNDLSNSSSNMINAKTCEELKQSTKDGILIQKPPLNSKTNKFETIQLTPTIKSKTNKPKIRLDSSISSKINFFSKLSKEQHVS